MELEKETKEIFSKKTLAILLTISILTNIIVLIKVSFPNIIDDMQSVFISLQPPDVRPTDHIRGNPKAKITIIEYADFECYYCIQFNAVLKSIIKEADIRWVYRHYPLGNHKLAGKAAEASECAAEQGRFWEYADALYDLKGKFSEDTFIQIAKKTGLNVSTFEKCFKSGRHSATVAGHLKEGVDIKIKGTPTYFINGKRYIGSYSLEEFRKIIMSIKVN